MTLSIWTVTFPTVHFLPMSDSKSDDSLLILSYICVSFIYLASSLHVFAALVRNPHFLQNKRQLSQIVIYRFDIQHPNYRAL